MKERGLLSPWKGRAGVVKAFDAIVTIAVLGALFWYILQVIDERKKNLPGDKGNEFEFKKAEDLTERLADVKGINEITDEIIKLIQMVKNKDEYT